VAIANFIPELWDAAIQVPFEKELVYAQPKVVNTKYEGQIKEMGDTVHVSSVAPPTISSYLKTADLVTQDLTDSETAMVIDQGDYFSFRVNDVDKVQAAGDFESPATQLAGIGLKDKVDTFVGKLFYAGAHASNKLGRVTVVDGRPDQATTGQQDAYNVLVKLNEKLNKQSVPSNGRYVVVDATFLSCLLRDERFIHADKLGAAGPLLNGQVGRAAGFDILVSNNVPVVGGGGADATDLVIAAGISDAVSFANQINSVEALREQARFADIVRGLNIYGAKVFRPEGIATATVTYATPA